LNFLVQDRFLEAAVEKDVRASQTARVGKWQRGCYETGKVEPRLISGEGDAGGKKRRGLR
jgi:hypothetical protein